MTIEVDLARQPQKALPWLDSYVCGDLGQKRAHPRDFGYNEDGQGRRSQRTRHKDDYSHHNVNAREHHAEDSYHRDHHNHHDQHSEQGVGVKTEPGTLNNPIVIQDIIIKHEPGGEPRLTSDWDEARPLPLSVERDLSERESDERERESGFHGFERERERSLFGTIDGYYSRDHRDHLGSDGGRDRNYYRDRDRNSNWGDRDWEQHRDDYRGRGRNSYSAAHMDSYR